jgi:chemotaxis protein MotB
MRRRKKYVEEETVSHDRWVISYADFVTLLFAFFVVLFASAYRDKQAIIRVSNAVHNGFQALGAFPGGIRQNAIAYSGLPVESPEAPPPGMNKLDGAGPRPGLPAVDLLELRRELQSAMGDELKNHEIEMSFTPEGFVISLKELGFFDSGQAQLLPGAAEKIERIARILSKHGLELRVEGHSDNQPIHNAQFRSNWELSTARAMSVLLILVDHASYDPKKISVAGYGQYRPIADDTTPQGRRMNRRVDLVVLGVTPPPRAAQ